MSDTAGRHRAPGRYNPAAEIGRMAADAGRPIAKGSAILAASGGLVAAIALPAAADEPVTAPATAQSALAPAAAAVPAVTAPAGDKVDPAKDLQALELTAVAKPTGPSPAELRGRAERQRAAEAAEQQAAQEQAQQQAAAEQATPERTEQPATSRSSQRPAAPSSGAGSSSSTSAPSSSSTSAAATGSRSDIISIAKQYIGTPYVYGGSTPAGFDCSGFVQYVFGQAGVSVPRVTGAQQSAATPVSDPQPGDLVFFGSPAWHVGIYVGNGQMIDAPRTGSSVSIRPVFSGVSGYGRL